MPFRGEAPSNLRYLGTYLLVWTGTTIRRGDNHGAPFSAWQLLCPLRFLNEVGTGLSGASTFFQEPLTLPLDHSISKVRQRFDCQRHGTSKPLGIVPQGFPSSTVKLACVRLSVRRALEGMPRKVAVDYPSSARISLVSRHLHPENSSLSSTLTSQNQIRKSSTMSCQPEHPTLLIPGPIEFDDAVLQSMSHYR